MKKWIFIIIFIISIGIGIYFFMQNSHHYLAPSSNYSAQKLSSNTNSSTEISPSQTSNSSKQTDTTKQEKNTSNKNKKDQSSSSNTNLSKFSTRLPHDTKARYSNIKLACETLDGTIVESGDTFSLWDTLGCPTKQKGYRQAKAFTSDGKIKKSYGGGICQVSTTIYNALLKVDGIQILERHEHSRDVVYIKDGKDAAVSYKTADLKFKNKLDYAIKMKAYVSHNRVVIKLQKVS